MTSAAKTRGNNDERNTLQQWGDGITWISQPRKTVTFLNIIGAYAPKIVSGQLNFANDRFNFAYRGEFKSNMYNKIGMALSHAKWTYRVGQKGLQFTKNYWEGSYKEKRDYKQQRRSAWLKIPRPTKNPFRNRMIREGQEKGSLKKAVLKSDPQPVPDRGPLTMSEFHVISYLRST